MADTTNTAALDPSNPLDAIALEAQGMEAEAERAQQEALGIDPEPEVIDQAQIWAQVPLQLGRILSMAMPELREVYTPEACLQWGTGMAAVSDKYGWDAGETLGKWAPEIMLVTATLPLAIPTVNAIRVRKRAYDARKAAQDAKTEAPEGKRPMHDLNDPPATYAGQEAGNFDEPR